MQRDPRKMKPSEFRAQDAPFKPEKKKKKALWLLKLEGKFEQSRAESRLECRLTYPLWTSLAHRMLTVYYKAGNDS